MLSYILGKYLGVEGLGHLKDMCNFLRNCQLFSKVPALLYTSSWRVSVVPHPHQYWVWSVFFILTTLISVCGEIILLKGSYYKPKSVWKKMLEGAELEPGPAGNWGVFDLEKDGYLKYLEEGLHFCIVLEDALEPKGKASGNQTFLHSRTF